MFQPNAVIRAFYQRLLRAGKSKKLALVACMWKLLTILNTMVRQYKIGTTATLTVMRGADKLSVPVELVRSPKLEREMKMMQEGGIGGFEVQPVYPLTLDDQKNVRTLPFLSDEFLDALRFTSAKSKQLGLRMDLTLGSGWPYGGPQVPITQAAGMLRWARV